MKRSYSLVSLIPVMMVFGGLMTFTLPVQLYAQGQISGIKFNDLNFNGRRDPGEPGIKGWSIHAVGPVSRTKITNDSGEYSFVGLAIGTYTISEYPKSGWVQTMPPSGTYDIQISNEKPVWDSVDFGNFTTRISGMVFNDLNSNGRQDPGEPGLEGWIIRTTGARSKSTHTDSAGRYSFTKLLTGSYQVYVRPKPGWIQTMPSPPGMYNVELTSDTPFCDNIIFGNNGGMRFNAKIEGMGFKIPTEARLMTCNLACDTGDIYICGYSNGWDTRMDYVTIKYKDANQSWVAHYNNSAVNRDDRAFALALDKTNGSVYVTGESYDGTSKADIATVKYNTDGTEQWVARWSNTAASGLDAGYAVALNQTGTIVFVTGETYGGSTNKSDYITIAYDAATGAKLWQATYNGPGSKVDKAYAITVAANGNPVVTGESDGGSTRADYATIMYDAATGAQVWVARYDGRHLRKDYAFAIKADNIGNVYVTGASQNPLWYDYATIKYNVLGDTQWVRYYDNRGRNDYAYDLVLDSSGCVYVTGASQGPRSLYGFATVKYDPTGVRVWVSRYEKGRNIARSIDFNGIDKKIFVTGSSYVSTLRKKDYLIQKIDATSGATDWITLYNGKGSKDDIAYNVKVCPSGDNLVVAGISYGGPTQDLLTLRFPSAGSASGLIENPDAYADEEPYGGPDEDLGEGSAEESDELVPANIALGQNYPNPFNPTTIIQYQLPTDSRVSLKVYNLLGEVIATLVNQTEPAGYKQVSWNASSFASGVYFYRLEAVSVSDPGKSFTSVKKMVLVK